MRRIRIYRNPNCAKCARYAKVHRMLDWLNRVETSTETPRTGPLRMGQIVVEDLRTLDVVGGVEAFRLIILNIPAYWPLQILLIFPPIRNLIEKETNGNV